MFNYSFSGADCEVWAWFTDQGSLQAYKAQEKKINKVKARLEKQKEKIEEEKQKALASLQAKVNKHAKVEGGKGKNNVIEVKYGIGKQTQTVKVKAKAPDGKFTNDELRQLITITGEPYDEAIKLVEKHINKIDTLSNTLNPALPIRIDSVATLSVSVHEPKGFVRKLGHKDICGVSRSVRTIAGTMICVVVNDHPLAKLITKDPIYQKATARRLFEWTFDQQKGTRQPRTDWAGDWTGILHNSNVSTTNVPLADSSGMRLATGISPFNLYVDYKTEFPNSTKSADYQQITAAEVTSSGASYALLDITILSEGITSSVNDMVTEISFQFIAGDMVPFNSRTLQSYSDVQSRAMEVATNLGFKGEIINNIKFNQVPTQQELQAQKAEAEAKAKQSLLAKKNATAQEISSRTGAVIDQINSNINSSKSIEGFKSWWANDFVGFFTKNAWFNGKDNE